jgi:carbamate kinase
VLERDTVSVVVLALGGNALLRRGERLTPRAQLENLVRASRAIAELARSHRVVVTHGSGPQVGLLAQRAESAGGSWHESLDVLEAEIEGMIGYLLQREIRNSAPELRVVTLLTQVVVHPDDPAFLAPAKPIGAVYPHETAMRLARERGWTVAPDGDGWRRVVPSPDPLRIVEIESIRTLVDAGHVVVCGGGGGVPVREADDGGLSGVEAVVDKDLTASLLAVGLEAALLCLLTDVRGIHRRWPDSGAPIHEIRAEELAQLELASGSMAPKALAAARFARSTGRAAVVGAMEDAVALVAGGAGTRVLP